MTVGVLIITHGQIGSALLETAVSVLDASPLPARALSVAPDCDPERLVREAKAAVAQLDQGDGVIVCTDLYGSTPSNIATALQYRSEAVRVISGVNLPMLVRMMNYPSLDILQLIDKALSGGREGIFLCTAEAYSD
jgi:PTS system ascorbate-specific IIA component